MLREQKPFRWCRRPKTFYRESLRKQLIAYRGLRFINRNRARRRQPQHARPPRSRTGNKTHEAVNGLTSLVSLDDVIRYLRQCDEVFLETDDADELLARASHKRTSQGLPSSVLLPAAPTHAPRPAKPVRTKEVAPPRPPTARERAEWARRAVALPAL